VSALKSLTIDIGSEVREHNRLLREVDDDFDSTTGSLILFCLYAVVKLFGDKKLCHFKPVAVNLNLRLVLRKDTDPFKANPFSPPK
jgi:hypothetical protein